MGIDYGDQPDPAADGKARMEATGLAAVGCTQAHLREVLARDIETWRKWSRPPTTSCDGDLAAC
jgi:hypothetical protein